MLADVTFLFNDWEPVWRVLFIAFTGYLTLLVLLRLSGQRTLAQMSSLDFVITVTIGSAFGRVITAREVAVVEVLAAFVALVLLQRMVAYAWGRLPRLRRHIASPPALLYYDGQVIESTMRTNRLREEDLRTAARQSGLGSLEGVKAILLESNGSFAVLTAEQFGDGRVVEAAEGRVPR